ncbi:unnamed protein product [Tuber aestivum]|uniref:Uncharacterized protein n=1 Tax=Tuber aestivum TaxID=59557 RepID=A0A292PZF9_9PEZI|nr:unnamed protein product [Tuber aestivum]
MFFTSLHEAGPKRTLKICELIRRPLKVCEGCPARTGASEIKASLGDQTLAQVPKDVQKATELHLARQCEALVAACGGPRSGSISRDIAARPRIPEDKEWYALAADRKRGQLGTGDEPLDALTKR